MYLAFAERYVCLARQDILIAINNRDYHRQSPISHRYAKAFLS